MSAEGDVPRRLPRYCVEDIDRYGNIRIYLRRKGQPKIKLDGTPWTPDFMRQYDEALGAESKPSPGVQPNTWEWLCRKYLASDTFKKQLTAGTQRIRQRIIVRTFDEPLKPGSPARFGDMPLSAMSPKAVAVLRDRLLATPENANARLKAIRQVFIFGATEFGVANVARDVEYIRNPTDGFYTATVEDVLLFEARHPIGTKAYLAMAIMLYTGARKQDAVLLGRQHVKAGRVKFKPAKTRATSGVTIDVTIDPELQRAIDAGPCGDLTFLVTEFGRPFTSNGFGNWFRDRCREAGLEQASAHSFRKGGATMAADGGATDAQLQAMYGWTSAKMPAVYRKKANAKRLADGANRLISVQLRDPVGHSSKKPA